MPCSFRRTDFVLEVFGGLFRHLMFDHQITAVRRQFLAEQTTVERKPFGQERDGLLEEPRLSGGCRPR